MLPAFNSRFFLPDYTVIAGAAGWMGRSYLAQGEVQPALEVMEAAQVVFSAAGSDLGYGYLGMGLAEAYLEKAEAAQGEDRQLWLKKAGIESRKTLKVIKRTSYGTLPDVLLVQGRYQWLRGKQAEAQNVWQRALAKAGEFGDPYQQGMLHLEIGRRLGERDHLLRAESILEEIGAEFDLAVARETMKNLQES